MRLLPLILTITIIHKTCNATDCVFTDTGSTTNEMDLRALAHTDIKGTDDEYNYIYTPCRNGDKCSVDGATDTGMAIQQKDPDECYILANWDHDETQPEYNSIEGTWKFEYKNGNDCQNEPRNFFIYFNCDMTSGDYVVTSAGEITACTYEMYIDSKWACPGEVYTPPSSSSISGGTIFLISFACVLLLYFIIGWIVCAFMNQKDRGFSDVVGNIPHLTFWSKLPALVFAGCCFTKDFFVGMVSGKGSSGSISPGSDDDDYDNLDK